MKVLLLYYSKTGHTREAVNAMAEGIRAAGSEADIVTAKEFNAAAVVGYDGFIVGSPCWAGSITGSGIARPLVRALSALPDGSLENMNCGAIAVYSEMGGRNTVDALCKLLSRKGCKNPKPGPAARAGVPFSVWKGPSVGQHDEEQFREFGTNVCSLTH